LDDLLVPRLRLAPIDRAAYCHLPAAYPSGGKAPTPLFHALAGTGYLLRTRRASRAVRRLTDHGALRLLECSNAGHVAEVRLPEEVLADLPPKVAPAGQPEGLKRPRIR